MRARTHRRTWARVAALTALGLASSCGGDAKPTTESTGDATTGESTTTGLTSVELTTEPTTQASDTEVSPDVSCACAVPDPLDLWLGSYDIDGCGWGPCGSIEFIDGVLDVAALDCALDMLIAGTPGVVHFTSHAEVFVTLGGFVRIGDARRGLSRTWEEEDLGCVVSPLEMIQLKDAAYFSDCKAMPDPRDRYDCLTDWSAGPVGSVCADEVDCSSAIRPSEPAPPRPISG